jgi:hypothetical protein
MGTIADTQVGQTDFSSTDPLTQAIDRWIFVFMAAWFIVIVLTGFVPDSMMKVAAIEAGQRPPFPLALHMHSVLMGSFLLILLAQATLVATGKQAHHEKLGILGAIIAPALVVAGFVLSPTIYHQILGSLQTAPADVQAQLQQQIRGYENIVLAQLRIGVMFSVCILIALRARRTDSGLHKRMMFLAVAVALPAAFTRITWLPNTMPESPLSPNLYILLAVAPMFIWDVVRTRTVHKAYVIWFAMLLPTWIALHVLWDTDWWHATAQRLMGV